MLLTPDLRPRAVDSSRLAPVFLSVDLLSSAQVSGTQSVVRFLLSRPAGQVYF